MDATLSKCHKHLKCLCYLSPTHVWNTLNMTWIHDKSIHAALLEASWTPIVIIVRFKSPRRGQIHILLWLADYEQSRSSGCLLKALLVGSKLNSASANSCLSPPFSSLSFF